MRGPNQLFLITNTYPYQFTNVVVNNLTNQYVGDTRSVVVKYVVIAIIAAGWMIH